MYRLLLMIQAQRVPKKLNASGLKDKTLTLIEIIRTNPLQYPPDFECF
jgi:toxin YoeB